MTPLWWESGATGGVAAKTLAQQGLSCVGARCWPPAFSPGCQYQQFTQGCFRLLNLATRKQSYQALHPGYWKANPNLFCQRAGKSLFHAKKIARFFNLDPGADRWAERSPLTWGGITCGFRLPTSFKALPATMVMVKTGPSAMENWTPFYAQLERAFQGQGNRRWPPH